MPLSHFSKLFAVEDARIAKITADPSGGTTTLATSIDVPGIKEVSLEGEINVVSLRGDNTELDSNATLQSLTATVAHAKVHLDILAILMGGTVADSGVTPNQLASWELGVSVNFSPFQLTAQTPTNGVDFAGGASTLTLYRCQLAAIPTLGLAEEDYRTVSFQVRCVPRLSDGKRVKIDFQETKVALT